MGAVASLVARVDAQVATFEKQFQSATRTAQKFEKDFSGVASSVSSQQKRINDSFNSFSGDKLAREASAVAKAVEQIGGASKLTAAEQARVNAVVTEAIEKYRVLGQVAPKSLVDLEQATRRVETAAVATQRTTSIFGQSLDTLENRGTLSGKAMGLLTSAFGQFTAAGVAVGIINKLTGELGRLVDQGVKLGPVQASFNRLADTVGEDSEKMLSSLQTATRGLVSNYDLMLASNKAMLLGLPVTAESMTELARTASVLGKAMGQDATKSFDDLITALGRSSPLILDNLGLTVRVEEANQKYAASLGKTAEKLTDAEKKMAFYVEAMSKARERTQQIGEQTLTLGEIFTSVWTKVGNVVSGAVSKVNTAGGAIVSETASGLSRIGSFLSSLSVNGIKGAAAMGLVNDQMAKVVQSRGSESIQKAAVASKKLADNLEETAKSARKVSPDLKKVVDLTSNMVRVVDGFGPHGDAMRDWLDDIQRTLAEDAKRLRDFEDAIRGVGITITTGFSAPPDAMFDWLPQIHKQIDTSVEKTVTFEDKLRNLADVFHMVGSSAGGAFGLVVSGIGSAIDAYGELLRVGKNVTAQLAVGAGGVSQVLASSGGTRAQNVAGAAAGGFATGAAIGSFAGPGGTLTGGVIGGIAGGIIGFFRQTREYKDAKAAVESFEQQLASTFTATERLQLGNQRWLLTATAVGNAYRDAGRSSAEAEAAVQKLWASSKLGSDAVALSILEIQSVMEEASRKQDELANKQVDQSKAIDEATAGVRSRIAELDAEYNSLFKSIENEAPEEVMGIVEAATRARIEAIKSERSAAADQESEIIRKIKDGLGELGPEAEEARKNIEDALIKSGIKIPVEFVLPEGIKLPIPALASGGIVRKPTIALIGEAGPEAVVPLGGGSAGSVSARTSNVYMDGRIVGELVEGHLNSKLRRSTKVGAM